MSFENYEGTAIDTSIIEEVQPVVNSTETETVVETVELTNEGITTETPTEPESTTPTEIEIPGMGKLTVDEIKEMRQGSLRQSDYTKKTQELARQRKELEDAETFFNYVRQNPALIEALKTAETNPNSVVNRATPEAEKIDQLAYNLKAMEVDMKLNELKSKYGDIDEIALFQKANELGTTDLEFVLKGIRFEESKNVDVDSIIAKAKEAAKAELKAELEQNRDAVSTIVNTNQQQIVQNKTALTSEQKRVADAMGMTEDEYRKWL